MARFAISTRCSRLRSLLYNREALFDRADVIVLCAAYLGLEGTVAEGVNNHAVFAVFLEDRTGLHARYLVISARFGAGSMSPKMPAC